MNSVRYPGRAGGEVGPSATESVVERQHGIPPRFASLPVRQLVGVEFPVAVSLGIRFRGLAFRERAQAGPGLVIPRCRSIHTFGMRFPLTIVFLDLEDGHLAIHRDVPPGRVLSDRRARAVLEVALPLDPRLADGVLDQKGERFPSR